MTDENWSPIAATQRSRHDPLCAARDIGVQPTLASPVPSVGVRPPVEPEVRYESGGKKFVNGVRVKFNGKRGVSRAESDARWAEIARVRAIEGTQPRPIVLSPSQPDISGELRKLDAAFISQLARSR